MNTNLTCSMPGPGKHEILKDDVYYWDTVCFSVQGCAFKVPQYQFMQGSEYFTTTYLESYNRDEASSIILQGITPPQFRTFLKLLFPLHSTSTTLVLTKNEWLTILTLSTLWQFNDLRKLSIHHLQSHLSDPFELINVGRAAYVSSWVLSGYEILVTRPEAISEEESAVIGHLTTVRLYIIRHKLGNIGASGTNSGLDELLRVKFNDELELLTAQESERRTKYDLELEKEAAIKAAEEQQLRDENLKRENEAKELDRLAAEKERCYRKNVTGKKKISKRVRLELERQTLESESSELVEQLQLEAAPESVRTAPASAGGFTWRERCTDFGI